MKAAIFRQYGGEISIENVPDPELPTGGVVIRVDATGICRSDWHGWMGHDSDVHLPHVPGHELAGTIEAVGKAVTHWKPGDKVTVPFSVGCGTCPQCRSGNHQICDNYFQPGFTAWGSFAEYVAIPYADTNLVAIPQNMTAVETASLGCRFITSFRAVVAQGQVKGGEWVAVHGCGGVGLSAIMIAASLGAQVIAIDIDDTKLKLAESLGATHGLNGKTIADIPAAIHDLCGGVHVSIDALGSVITCRNSVLSLRKRGKHIQVGLLGEEASHTPIPMGTVVSKELEIIGSHGMQAHVYPQMFDLIAAGKIEPGRMVTQTIALEAAPSVLQQMGQFANTGITVINQF